MSFTQGAKASQACISCRKQKRKCDKTLPMCSLCGRMGRPCDYSDGSPPVPTADDLASLHTRLAELEQRLRNPAVSETSPSVFSDASRQSVNSRGPLWLGPPSMNRFPSAIFLDIDCFKWAQLPIPKPNVDVPQDVYEILSHGNAVQEATAEYFDSVHHWFPIISKKRMSLGISLWEGGPDLAMLFLAMKLVTSQPVAGVDSAVDNHLYTASKRFLALLEGSGTLSLIHLQSMILVTLYEFGHAIYPAAWMSIAMCARYIDIIGIPSFKESSLMLGSCATWTESEERRRVWWAVYILDRAICLGNKKRYSLPEPEDNFILPVDDRAWDDGDPSRGLQASINTPAYQPQGPFARLAQVSMLISQTTTHCRTTVRNNLRNTASPFDITSVQSLIDTLISFGRIAQNDQTSPCTPPTPASTTTAASTTTPEDLYFALLAPRCLALSALIQVLDVYSCPENLRDGPGPGGIDAPNPKTADELAMQVRAISGLRDASMAVRDLSLEMLEAVMLPAGQRRLSPLCLDALYAAMATLHWLWKEGGDAVVGEALEDVRRAIGRLAMRWRLANEYIDMVHHHDVTTIMAWKGVSP
ncbi:hypothetical protein B0T25DRAFT_586894 [Lasiosphaeria hispida]|uniref:Zn(2)-C6 fungal-type domain-containing protein n=1 Tax=Lasiosphaeria hispida TaxID=260671 RepID=A0AAJ0HU14_9PEZI|nr:hypothetical protein B0T25DRAFT_586894 [Lasiosphaeria hispida]